MGLVEGVSLWYALICAQISLISIDSPIALLKEELHTSDDGLRIEITIETLIGAGLEFEEEKHQFASL